jgi:hypothetical protein
VHLAGPEVRGDAGQDRPPGPAAPCAAWVPLRPRTVTEACGRASSLCPVVVVAGHAGGLEPLAAVWVAAEYPDSADIPAGVNAPREADAPATHRAAC